MTIRRIARPFAVAMAVVALAPSAQAQLFRAYLSSTGNDANPCTLVSPCRLLPAALTAVADGGEIWMLDSANYNTATVNINKSVSVVAVPGVLGSVVGSGSTPALLVQTSSTKVALRNLRIVTVAGSPGSHGIHAMGPVELVIEGSVIAGFAINGVYVTGAATLRMSDTIVRDNTAAGVRIGDGAQATLTRVIVGRNSNGVFAHSGSSANDLTRVSISDSTIEHNGTGIWANTSTASAATTLTVRASTIDRNTSYGISAQSTAGGATKVVAVGNGVTGNAVGMLASGTGSRLVAGSNLVAGNVNGLYQQTGAIFESMGTNTLKENTNNDKVGSISTVPTE